MTTSGDFTNEVKLMEEMTKCGAAFRFNGQDADWARLETELANLELAEQERQHVRDSLNAAFSQMGVRALETQYIPQGEGRAPTINLRTHDLHAGQKFAIGAAWDRDLTPHGLRQKNWWWPF